MMRRRTPVRALCQLGLAALVVLVAPSFASAQGNIIVFEEETIQVEIEKPEAFYILSPSNLDYRSLDPEESFLEELYETVEDDPF